MTSGGSGECNNGEYMTHPAFISLGVNGIWVGKFETGYNGATSVKEARVNANNSSKIIVKPNVYSWCSNTVNNMFLSSYNYKPELGSHMMKNTEWGAAAILSHSVYGVDTEVNINNNSLHITGYSAVQGTDQSTYPGTIGTAEEITLPYNTPTGYKASTTGNISGVYDMSGGAHEYMAAYKSESLGESEFNDVTNPIYKNYIDVYSTSSYIQTYQYRILGDATGEMGPFLTYNDGDGNSRYHNSWYADQSDFPLSTAPWFYRGGYSADGILASQFQFYRNSGNIDANIGFRIVLAK